MRKVPQKVLEAARLKFKRQCAALICQAVAEDGRSISEIAAQIGWDEGKWWREIKTLLEGKTKRLDTLSDMLAAMACELAVSATPMQQTRDDADLNPAPPPPKDTQE